MCESILGYPIKYEFTHNPTVHSGNFVEEIDKNFKMS